jgi:dihydrofolate reductase
MAQKSRSLQCSVYIALSVDGFIARPDDGLDWLSVVEQRGEDYGYKAFADTVDTMVIGRRTYDVVRKFPDWPYAGKRCVVLTRRPVEPRYGEEFFEGTPRALVERLEREGARRAYIDGGNVIRQFIDAGLVDDLTLSIIPVVLGAGIPLFASGSVERGLAHVETKSFRSGLVQVVYKTLGGFGNDG